VASCSNGLRDGDETDIDCGGACAPCAVGLQCAAAPDCASGLCTAGRCATPTGVCTTFSACSTFLDLADAGTATIRFPVGGNRYSPPCVRVHFGQTVIFEGGDFGNHPLTQSCGPVANVLQSRSGNRFTVSMGSALGKFGFFCNQHGQRSGSGMAGAIEVVR
jgi:plastocyanin